MLLLRGEPVKLREQRLRKLLGWIRDAKRVDARRIAGRAAGEFGISFESARDYVDDLHARGWILLEFGVAHLAPGGRIQLRQRKLDEGGSP